MHQPATTNPLIIMCINMTIVFAVLIGLSFMIKFIHMIDPTKPKEEPAPAAPAAPVPAPVPEPEPEPVVEEGIPAEVVAAIAAAVASCGASGEIRAIRPVNRDGWKQSGRMGGLNLG